MDELLITKSALKTAIHSVENILKQPIDEINLTNTIPVSDEVADSNNVFKGKFPILFVDIRKSTDLTDELKSKKMVKIYPSFIRMAMKSEKWCKDILEIYSPLIKKYDSSLDKTSQALIN